MDVDRHPILRIVNGLAAQFSEPHAPIVEYAVLLG